MQYRGQEFQYVTDNMELETESVGEQSSKEYRRKRPMRSSRRRTSKNSGSHPGYGIAGRRNNRWAW